MAITKVNHPDLLDLASDTGATVFPKGTTAERPVSPEAGYIRFNTTDNVMETYDGTEWKVLDNFTPPYTVDYLVVAGGGGGGAQYAGGGGAGGLRTSFGTLSGGGSASETSLSLISGTSYNVIIGAGGNSTSNADVPAGNGASSSFDSITSIGGGAGGNAGGATTAPVTVGKDGGSGGGTGNLGGTAQGAAGNGTPGQGFDGGGKGETTGTGGGGGGAASAGGFLNAPDTPGGLGLAVSITGTSTTYSAGGIGVSNSILNGSNNTGNGGSGANAYYPSGAGGSGVVILRMPTANYSGIYSGNNVTVQEIEGDTIITYNESGTYTA